MAKTCCFTGHRKLPSKKIDSIILKLNAEVERLINEGVTTFVSGGALGFDQIAAFLIASKKELGYNIRLVLALPCKGQEDLWTPKEKQLYSQLLGMADSIVYVSETQTSDCMKKRNQYMVDQSQHCICAMLREKSDTGQTLRLAKQKGLEIINVAK